MPRRFTADGAEWTVLPSGRNTQYVRDEFGVCFIRVTGTREERVARYSPGGARGREESFAALSARISCWVNCSKRRDGMACSFRRR